MSLDLLERRLSVPSRQLGAPGPDQAQLEALLTAAIRVPDHGRLTPYRLLVVRGDARVRLGAEMAAIHARNEPDAPAAALAKDRERFNAAPLVVIVIARTTAGHKVPLQEQLLSAGCVAYNLLLGAQALGFGAQWLTGWSAYDADVARLFGLAGNESVVGFVHIGSIREPASEHARAPLADVLGEWSGPPS
ncbi:MAG: nitroreductase [Xanthomonadales bacterium]|nr:nitroreductase [Xanthomonadales bacterium]